MSSPLRMMVVEVESEPGNRGERVLYVCDSDWGNLFGMDQVEPRGSVRVVVGQRATTAEETST